ncbi:Immunoglobulin E-set [Lasallia pustulata]|uniref:Immunoglobulin E-set n=1 Tax=Lasallia pustulata TaxID=136370 RepID=A0A1W5CY02_9LECA|nr:Immunoglobulin E-set [Lasallia pustulata]
MPVRIQLDKPHAYFTNLDYITGRVILSTVFEETISAVIVKLEGESRTRLAGDLSHGADYAMSERPRTELEVHKLLYNVVSVFPSPDLQRASPRNAAYTLPPGQHEYPFQFKLPFNNDCASTNSVLTNLNMVGMRVEMARNTERHVKKTLPPSLSGFPGEAEIRYFVKVTVQRPSFFKENFRATADFKFFPIEPPRPPDSKRESYARRQHQFLPSIAQPLPTSPLYRKGSSTKVPGILEKPPKISIDGRLPDPAIITCNEILPLRILISKMNDSPDTIFLQMLQIELIGYTFVRAHDFSRTESTSWIIVSHSNLRMPFGGSQTSAPKEMEVSRALWNTIPLSNTVAPTFETCNLSRQYVLEIRVGLAYGSPGNIKPELTVQPLRMPVQVYSGIAPPEALLAAMAATPVAQSQPRPYKPPPFAHVPSRIPLPEFGDEAPPSYEDAMAENVGPVVGARRDYEQPSTPAGAPDFGADWKRDSM